MAVKAGVDARTLIDTVNAPHGPQQRDRGQVPAVGAAAELRLRRQGGHHVQGRELCLEEAKALGVPMWVGAPWSRCGQGDGGGPRQDDFTP